MNKMIVGILVFTIIPVNCMDDLSIHKNYDQTLILSQKNSSIHAITFKTIDGASIMIYQDPKNLSFKKISSLPNDATIAQTLTNFLQETKSFHSYLFIYQDFISENTINGIAFKQNIFKNIYNADKELLSLFQKHVITCLQKIKK